VLARRPGATLRLVGAPGPGLRRQARLPGVVVEGFQEDLAPILGRSRLAVSPLRFCSGLQNKVLETMACGLPTVVTSMVAEPLGAPQGSCLVVADSAQEIAAAILRLMDHEDEARRIGAAGSAWVREHFPGGGARNRLAELLNREPAG
jgi:glycosyltransferase involved in cell wall biosynthesis